MEINVPLKPHDCITVIITVYETSYSKMNQVKFLVEPTIFFISLGFSFTCTDGSWDSRGRDETIFISLHVLHLPTNIKTLFATLHVRWVPPIFNHTTCNFQTAVRWDNILDEIYHLLEWQFDWLMMGIWNPGVKKPS